MEVPFIISLKTFPEIPGNIRIAMTSAENPIRQKKGSIYKIYTISLSRKPLGTLGNLLASVKLNENSN